MNVNVILSSFHNVCVTDRQKLTTMAALTGIHHRGTKIYLNKVLLINWGTQYSRDRFIF